MASIPVETGKIKDICGRRIKGYYASIGDIRGEGKTPQEALSKLQEKLERACKFSTVHTYTVRGYGIVIAPYHGNAGHHVMLCWPDGHISAHTTNEQDPSKCRHDVLLHIAQLLYPAADAADILEGTGKESEFASWVQFQDAYKQAKANGMNDTEAHKYACEWRG